jgi:hypothetical protein
MVSPAAKRRSSFPLHAYIGPNGGGKSLAMVYDTLPALDIGRTVLSTVALYDIDGSPHPCYVPLVDYRQILEARHCDILMDEVTGVASSREHQAMPAQLANKLVQLRRADVRVRWSTPWYNRADSILREITQAITICNGHLGVKVESEDGLAAWKSNRFFSWVTYDAKRFKDFDNDEPDKAARTPGGKRIKPECRQWYLRTKNSRAANCYDTGEDVLRLTHLDDHGRCIECGGTRTRSKCTCAPVAHRAAQALSRREVAA